MAPHGCYPCSGEDRWCAIAVETDEHWRRLGSVVAEEWMSDAKLATVEGRLSAAVEIDQRLAAWTAARTAEEVEGLLRCAGVPVSRVVTGDDMAADERAHEAGIFAAVAHPTAGTRVYTAAPVVTASGERPPTRRPPLLGEHTERMLFEVLRLDARRAHQLIGDGAAGH